MDRDREFARLVAIEMSAEGARRRITQKQIAAAMGLHPNQMSYYKSGSKGDMTVARLLLAAERLRVSPELIVERAYAALIRDFGEPPAVEVRPASPPSGPVLHDLDQIKAEAPQTRD